MPRLRKHGRVDDDLLGKWAIRVHRENLGRAGDAEAVLNAWNSVPKNLRTDTSLLEAYFAALMRTEQHDKAEKEIAAELKREWRAPLVRLFGMIAGSDPAKQLSRAEGWLKPHPDDPDLLLAAARLCLKNELWGKARSYLETAISIRPSPEAYEEYGRLLNQLGESEAAADAYKAGLNIVAGTPLRAIPDLRARSGVS